jgi:hypothetical protein
MTAQLTSRLGAYESHLAILTGRQSPDSIVSRGDVELGVRVYTYDDLPGAGLYVSFTYGLSLGRQATWKDDKPELVLCLNSDDPSWAESVAALTLALRQECPFDVGVLISMDSPVVEDSPMTGWAVTAASTVPETHEYVAIPDGRIVLRQLIPVFATEIAQLRIAGLDWIVAAAGWDPYDVQRAPTI